MTATTIKQIEAVPASYPDAPGTLSTEAAALDLPMVWQRLEAYVAHRWTERAVTWIVEGCGEWEPPLTPSAITTVEIWSGSAWEAVTLGVSPLDGYVLPGFGPYRLTGTAGPAVAPAPPAAVLEAFRRLAEYMAADPGTAGATTQRVSVAGIGDEEISRSASWAAKAITNSGAGDMLRPYRRA